MLPDSMSRSPSTELLADWHCLSDETQLIVTRAALSKAAETIAAQAECLADEMERGTLSDRGGVDALRLLACVVRSSGESEMAPLGRA